MRIVFGLFMARVIIKFRILTLAFLAVAITAPKCVGAISMFGCSDRGVELRSNFSVKVKFQGRPLPGVSIEVRGADESEQQSHSELTGPDGLARFANMPPGNYWMKADFLGIAARYECFHINSTRSDFGAIITRSRVAVCSFCGPDPRPPSAGRGETV
jgi:hypothetical protein